MTDGITSESHQKTLQQRQKHILQELFMIRWPHQTLKQLCEIGCVYTFTACCHPDDALALV